MGGTKGRSNNGANNNENELATLKQQNEKPQKQNFELQKKFDKPLDRRGKLQTDRDKEKLNADKGAASAVARKKKDEARKAEEAKKKEEGKSGSTRRVGISSAPVQRSSHPPARVRIPSGASKNRGGTGIKSYCC